MANRKTEQTPANAVVKEPADEKKIDFSGIEAYLKRSYVNGAYSHNTNLLGQCQGALFVLRYLGYKVERHGTTYKVTE